MQLCNILLPFPPRTPKRPDRDSETTGAPLRSNRAGGELHCGFSTIKFKFSRQIMLCARTHHFARVDDFCALKDFFLAFEDEKVVERV